MLSNCDIQKLEQMQRDFHYVTGVSITPFYADGTPITTTYTAMGEYCTFVNLTETGRFFCEKSNRILMKKCRESKQIERHICAWGLCDIAIPLLHREEIIGYLLIGQIRTSDTLPENAHLSNRDPLKIEEYYYKIPLFDERMIESVISIGSIMTKYIIFENIIKAFPRKNTDIIADYIEDHLSEPLHVKTISQNTHISVSGIYKSMKNTYGKTLGEYILHLRMSRAEALLKEENLSMEKVAEMVGYSDPAYFSRCFKKTHGISPMKFKKLSKS